MAAKLTLSNRQRKVQLDLAFVREMAEKLTAALFRNLLNSPPEHLDESAIEEMAERGTFSVVLTSNTQIRKLNKEWMGKDYPTDVLSFPLEMEPPALEDIPWELGEIIISVEKADEQAENFGHSFEREMAFLCVHGMLHVLGFDHIKPADEKDMFARQKQILLKAGFKR